MAVLERYAVDFLIFTETDGVSPEYRSLTDTFLITETYANDYFGFGDSDLLNIAEDYTNFRILYREEQDTLELTDRYAFGTQDRSAIDTLGLTEDYDKGENWLYSVDTLTITETNNFTVSFPVSDTLDITEEYTYNVIRSLSVTDTLTISEGYNHYLPDPYNPSYAISNANSVDPILFRDGSLEFESRHYEFGNVETVEFTRVVQETRGGDLIVGPNKAMTESLQFTLLQVTEAKCNQLMSFMKTTLGKEIEFRDHEGVWWDGVILNPSTPRVQNGRNRFTMAIQFEGVRQ